MAVAFYCLDVTGKRLIPLPARQLQELGLTEARDLESWLASSDGLLGRRILWIARQDHPSDDQRSDLVGLDEDGDLLVAELKRGQVNENGVTQALCYAAEYAELNAQEISELYAAHVCRDGSCTLVDRVGSADEAQAKIVQQVGEDKEINESQLVVLVAEDFSPKALALSNYLNEASGEATFSIECWRYAIYRHETGSHFFSLEQILPPPDIRDAVEQGRLSAKEGKYARNPAKRDYLRAAYSYFKAVNLTATRKQGSTYACILRGSGWDNEASAEFSVHASQPRLILTDTLSVGEPDLEEFAATARVDEYGRKIVEFRGVNTETDQFDDRLGARIVGVMERIVDLRTPNGSCEVEA